MIQEAGATDCSGTMVAIIESRHNKASAGVSPFSYAKKKLVGNWSGIFARSCPAVDMEHDDGVLSLLHR
jgi:hypothetical protein